MAIDLYHIIDIDFGGGDADSVVLIAWHLGIDKSCVLALLLYQESDIQVKLLHFFFFFLGGGGGGGDDEWWMDDEWIMMQLLYIGRTRHQPNYPKQLAPKLE